MTTQYVIKQGDTLWAIGKNIVGLNWRFIHAMNPQIKDPNKIFVDQVITIPNPQLVYWLS
jgi:nucleoid-associated protein YgaU